MHAQTLKYYIFLRMHIHVYICILRAFTINFLSLIVGRICGGHTVGDELWLAKVPSDAVVRLQTRRQVA